MILYRCCKTQISQDFFEPESYLLRQTPLQSRSKIMSRRERTEEPLLSSSTKAEAGAVGVAKHPGWLGCTSRLSSALSSNNASILNRYVKGRFAVYCTEEMEEPWKASVVVADDKRYIRSVTLYRDCTPYYIFNAKAPTAGEDGIHGVRRCLSNILDVVSGVCESVMDHDEMQCFLKMIQDLSYQLSGFLTTPMSDTP